MPEQKAALQDPRRLATNARYAAPASSPFVIPGQRSKNGRERAAPGLFDFAIAGVQNPSKQGGIMGSKLFLTIGLLPILALTVNAQSVKQGSSTAHQNSPRFLQIVNESRKRVRETNVDEVKAKLDRGEKVILVDVREESEFAKDHLPGAIHLGKGVIERDIEEKVPDLNAPLVLYCGGGYRSTLAADSLQKMGYKNVLSMDGGIRVWREKGFPLAK
jgi:rhodanese-related sulfurtransferase